MIVTGDVTDKGVPAALVMASTHALLRAAAQAEATPGRGAAPGQRPAAPADPDPHVRDLPGAHHRPGHGRDDVRQRRAQPALPVPQRRGVAAVGPRHAAGPDAGQQLRGARRTDRARRHRRAVQRRHHRAARRRTARCSASSAPRRSWPRRGSGAELVDEVMGELAAFARGVEQEDDITLVAISRPAASGTHRLRFTVPSAAGNEREAMDRVVAFVGRRPAARPARLPGHRGLGDRDERDRARQPRPGRSAGRGRGRPSTRARSRVAVTDLGGGRPAGDVEMPDLDLKLAGLQSPRGWGLFLVEQLVDSVTETDRRGRRIATRSICRCNGRKEAIMSLEYDVSLAADRRDRRAAGPDRPGRGGDARCRLPGGVRGRRRQRRPGLRRRGLHQLHRHRPDRGPAGQPPGPTAARCWRPG